MLTYFFNYEERLICNRSTLRFNDSESRKKCFCFNICRVRFVQITLNLLFEKESISVRCFSLVLCFATDYRVQLEKGRNHGWKPFAYLRRGYNTSILILRASFRTSAEFCFFHFSIYQGQKVLYSYHNWPEAPTSNTYNMKGWALFLKSRLDNTFRRKLICARAWRDQPIDCIGPIRPPVRPS